tara:strand:- start:149 stop:1030 length:882 start_codon:yes stop_codon:yes gene_type:complete
MTNINKKIEIKALIFLNGIRGYQIIKFLKNRIYIKKIFLSKKFLNKKILKKIKNIEIPFEVVNGINKKSIFQNMKDTDISLVCGFPYIFSKKHLKLQKFGMINCHAGRLPQYRGGSPLNWQIINQEKKIGISVIKMSSGIDEGEIINQMLINNKNFDIIKAHKIVNSIFPILIFKSINDLVQKKKLKKQNNKIAKYWKQRSKKDSEFFPKIYFASHIIAMIKALQKPYPNAFFFDGIKKISVSKASILNLKMKAGSIKYNKKTIILGCKDKSLRLTSYIINNNAKKINKKFSI